MAKVPVSIAGDISSGWNNHVMDTQFLPLYDYFDGAATMDWVGGKYMSKHSLAPSVLHKGQEIVLDTHDLGPMLPHAPSNYPLHLLKASRKNIYSASTVVAVKKPIACVDAEHPLMLCGDVAMPKGFNHTNAQHSVFVGTTALDESKGRAEILKTAIVDSLMLLMGPAKEPIDVAKDALGADPIKAAVGAWVGLQTSIAVSRKSGWKEPISLKMESGGGFASRNTEISYDPKTQQWSGKDSKNTLGMKEETAVDKDGVTRRSNDGPGGEMHDGTSDNGAIIRDPAKWGPRL